MPEVTHYDVLFYGGSEGYGRNRAQIRLYDAEGHSLARVRFRDPSVTLPDDSEVSGIWYMHLPSDMFQSVLDILRNEGPNQFYAGHVGGGGRRAFLGTFAEGEPVGEGEP